MRRHSTRQDWRVTGHDADGIERYRITGYDSRRDAENTLLTPPSRHSGKLAADEGMAEAIVNTASVAAGADREQLATKADLAGLRTEIASVRTELGTIRWSIGLLAAFMFAIGLRVFGIL